MQNVAENAPTISLGDEEAPSNYVWQDREIRFDSPLQCRPSVAATSSELAPPCLRHLGMRKGEFCIDSIDAIEVILALWAAPLSRPMW